MRTRITRASKETLLKRALQHVNSVPYQVSLRWVFYRVLQEGLLNGKSSYKQFVSLTAKARKQYEYGWSPSSLADETRKAIPRNGQFEDADEWFSAVENIKCSLDEWYQQPNYVEVWFEAKAMIDQFKHLTKYVTLVPFGGDASIDYKWKIAKRLEEADLKYNTPIKIIYFGDCDDKGKLIPYSALKDIEDWCSVSFDFINGGLTTEQAVEYNIPQDPDRPGSFQWEAVSDTAARQIISSKLDPLLDYEQFDKTRMLEMTITQQFREATSEILRDMDR